MIPHWPWGVLGVVLGVITAFLPKGPRVAVLLTVFGTLAVLVVAALTSG